MHFRSILGLSFAALSVAAPATLRVQCDADYCLRALRATQFTRLPQASADCSSYFAVTSTFTVTNTLTASETVVITSSATATETIRVTDVTGIIETQTTDVIDVTTTTTETSFTTSLDLLKRGETPTIPDYASPCSGTVRYESACRCIGVNAAPTVSVTVTESVTNTLTVTNTIPVTKATSITITDATETQTSFETLTRTFPSTVTETSTKTVEIFPTETFTNFNIKVTYPDNPSGPVRYLQRYAFSGLWYIVLVDSIDDATTFTMDGNALFADGHVVQASPDFGTLVATDTADIPSLGFTPITCQMNAYRQISCTCGNNHGVGDWPYTISGTYLRYMMMRSNDDDIRSYPGGQLIALKAIPA